MFPSRLPPESFEFFVGLGAERTYQAVANHYGVSKRAVAKRAAADRWQERLAALVSGARAGADRETATALVAAEMRHVTRVGELHDAVHDVLTVPRFKAVLGAMLKAAIQKDDVAAARLLFERVLGKPRNESLRATAFDLPDGLKTAADVGRAANALLQGVADGSLAPEDAQRAAAVLEAARRSIETEDLGKRIATIEETIKKEKVS